jgi:hypothetical protein
MRRPVRLTAFLAVVLLAAGFFGHLLPGCTTSTPYRNGKLEGLKAHPDCERIYSDYEGRSLTGRPFDDAERDHDCWRQSFEEFATYDLVVAEFSDQGWIQDSAKLMRPKRDYLDDFLDKLHERYAHWAKEGRGVSLVVYVHGWHHNAKPHDEDVVAFRRLLSSQSWLETTVTPPGRKRKRVIGVYVGWRGESVDVAGLRYATFWERKTTAERVALGTVRELMKRLDLFRDTSMDCDCERDVRMLIIGHSFGGLITYSALGAEFVRNAVRFKTVLDDGRVDKYMSRVGDLVVLVNPAFEGARYEPLHTAGQRLDNLEKDQLPVLVVTTSQADGATRVLFPMAQWFRTFFEEKNGYEVDAMVKAVGHNERYTTHELALCAPGDDKCRQVCPAVSGATPMSGVTIDMIEAEYRHMGAIAKRGFDTRQYLCGGLQLEATNQWHPKNNPYWVVHTNKDVIDGHSDLFNSNFVTFIRQLYLSVIYVREQIADKKAERARCDREGYVRPAYCVVRK